MPNIKRAVTSGLTKTGTAIPDVPDAPTIGTATNVGTSRAYNNGSATVAFTAAATGGTATSYTATSSPGGFTASGASSPLTVTGLQSATSYTFTVAGTNSTATGAVSAASSSITATTVPQAPTIGTATDEVTGGSVSVAFTPGATGGSAVTSYTATSSPGGITGTGSSSPISVSGLTVGTSYTFTVTATNANGTSSASSASNSVTPTNPPIIVVTAGTDYVNYSFSQDVYTNWTKIDNAGDRNASYPSASGRFHITYGAGRWVLMQEESTNKYSHSTNGTSWTKTTLPATARWISLAYSPGISLFVALSDSGTGVYSSNGTTWTSFSSAPTNIYQGLGKGSNKMVALGSNTARYSTNGSTWSTGSGIGSTTGCWTPVYGAPGGTGVYVAIRRQDSTATTTGYSSSDGITWTSRTLPSSRTWGGISYDGTAGRFMIYAKDSDIGGYSSNGTTWTLSTMGSGPDNNTGNTGVQWLASGYGTTWGVNWSNGARALTTDGGLNWSGYKSSNAPYQYYGGYEAAWNIDGGYG